MGWRLDVGSTEDGSGAVENRGIGVIGGDAQWVEAAGVGHQVRGTIRARRITRNVADAWAGRDAQAAALG